MLEISEEKKQCYNLGKRIIENIDAKTDICVKINKDGNYKIYKIKQTLIK